MKKLIVLPLFILVVFVNAQNIFPSSGNVGIGTNAPTANISFVDVNTTTNQVGIAWYNPNTTTYGIYRTAGAWSAPNYQQLKLAWATGIILDPASDHNIYTPSYVEVRGKGIRVSSGSIGIGTGIIDAPTGYLLAVNGKAIMEELKIKLRSSG